MKKTEAERSIAELNRRMIQSRRALAGWERVGTEMARAQIVAEIGALQGMLLRAPEQKRAVISALISKYGGKPDMPSLARRSTDELAEILDPNME
jgi:hypothetical protein